MDDDPRSRLRGWVTLMQKYGIEPPPETRQAALPRAPLGTFGGWAARSVPPPTPAPTPIRQPTTTQPGWARYGIDGPDAQPSLATPPRAFPVRNAPWGNS